MGFPTLIREDALVACGRHCCLCHRFCGIKMELHHIKPKASGGLDTFENAIPLCFDCHADMRTYDSKHPKGLKYTESELIRRRNDWYSTIKNSGSLFNANTLETDKQIYTTLLATLPWQGSLSFISTTNFAGFSFQLDQLNDLISFENLCDNPAFQFNDMDLEGLKGALLTCIRNFQELIGQHTFPTRNMGWNHVPPEWATENYPNFINIVSQIHSAAKAACDSYSQLMQLATIKLGMLPQFN